MKTDPFAALRNLPEDNVNRVRDHRPWGTLTVDEQLAYIRLKGGEAASIAARADADGLVQVIKRDRTKREIVEFEPAQPGQRKFWMDQFKAPGFVQVRISNSSNVATPAEKVAALAQFRLSHPDLGV